MCSGKNSLQNLKISKFLILKAIKQNSDLIISVGARMSIPMIGYSHKEFARKAKIIHVDIDKTELLKLKKKN